MGCLSNTKLAMKPTGTFRGPPTLASHLLRLHGLQARGLVHTKIAPISHSRNIHMKTSTCTIAIWARSYGNFLCGLYALQSRDVRRMRVFLGPRLFSQLILQLGLTRIKARIFMQPGAVQVHFKTVA